MRTIVLALALLLTIPIVASTAFAETEAGDTTAVQHAPEDLALDIYQGVTDGNWFLVAGAALCLVTIGARHILVKRWTAFGSDLWGVAIVAALAGFGALGNAWIAGADVSALTFIGAVKVWAAAVFTYVTTKKMIEARPRKPPPMYGSIDLLFVAIAASSLLACGPGPGPMPVIGQTVVDCTSANRADIDSLFAELSPLVFASSPDWAAVYQRAKHAGVAIGGCVLAELVQTYLGGRRAPANDDGWKARETLEEFRGAEAGGATFKTRFGNL